MGKKRHIEQRTYRRITELKCFEAVMQMILAGYPLPSVVEFIQQRKGESTDIKASSLLTILSDYRSTLPPMDVVAPFIPKRVIELQKEFEDSEQDLRDLSWAIDTLKENIAAAWNIVAETGMPSKNLQIDLDTLSRMVLRRHEIKMDLGLGGKGRNLGTLTVAPSVMRRVHDKHGQVFAEIISNPEKLSQVVSGAARLLDAAQRADETLTIDGEVIEDG